MSAAGQVLLLNGPVLSPVYACGMYICLSASVDIDPFLSSQDILVEKEFSSAKSHHSYRE